MIARLSNHPLLTWSAAWAITAAGAMMSDVFSDPRTAPLWPVVVAGALSWGLAGAATMSGGRVRAGFAVWLVAWLAAFVLAGIWGRWFEQNTVGSISSAGFVGVLLGWSAGAALGVLASSFLVPATIIRTAALAVVWSLTFFIGGFVGIVIGMIGGEVSKHVLSFVGNQSVALVMGGSLGFALGGAGALAVALSMRRVLVPVRNTVDNMHTTLPGMV